MSEKMMHTPDPDALSLWTYSAGSHPDYHSEDSRYPIPTNEKLFSKQRFIPGAVYGDYAMTAEHCADDYHDNHDGWEDSWPVEFRIYFDGTEVGRFDVERESRPHFIARAALAALDMEEGK